MIILELDSTQSTRAQFTDKSKNSTVTEPRAVNLNIQRGRKQLIGSNSLWKSIRQNENNDQHLDKFVAIRDHSHHLLSSWENGRSIGNNYSIEIFRSNCFCSIVGNMSELVRMRMDKKETSKLNFLFRLSVRIACVRRLPSDYFFDFVVVLVLDGERPDGWLCSILAHSLALSVECCSHRLEKWLRWVANWWAWNRMEIDWCDWEAP